MYGARGIKVCNEWRSNFINFYNWAVANGYDENAPRGKCTIDRIDVNGNYEPSNCRWVTMKEQANNKRNNYFIEYDGQIKTLSEWAKILDCSRGMLQGRMKKGWTIERVFTQPKRQER